MNVSLLCLSLWMLTFSAFAGAYADEWSYSAGGGLLYGPRYEGARKYSLSAVPELDAHNDNVDVFFDEDGLGFNALHGKNYDLGASVNYQAGRQESDDRQVLRGTGNVAGSVTGNLLADVTLWSVLDVGGSFSQAMTGDYGATASLWVKSGIPLSDRLTLTGSAGLTWANSLHMQNSYGIDASQSAASGYGRYDEKAGLEKTDYSVGILWNARPNVSIETDVLLSRLSESAAASPLVSHRINPAVFWSLTYNF